jgi:methyl-accepting chemotaxis protein
LKNRLGVGGSSAVAPRKDKPSGTLCEMIPMPILNHETLLLAFVAITAAAVLLQAILLLAIFLSVRKAARSIRAEIDGLRSSVVSVLDSARNLMARVAPKIEAAATDLAEITGGLRRQSAEVQSALQELLERLHRQGNRIEAMFSGVLDTVDRAGGFVAGAVRWPMRRFSGLLASARAIIESLRASENKNRPA